MTREPGKPGEKEVSRGREDERSYIGVTEGRPRCHARPGASLRRSVTAFCHGCQGKPAGGSDKAHDNRARVVVVSRGRGSGGESSIEDGKR